MKTSKQKVKEQRCEIIKKKIDFTREISMDPLLINNFLLERLMLKNLRLDQLGKIKF